MSKAQIISPLPGTFYRKTSPESPPFKQDGDPVSAADVIGLVEVMKNFQEVTADAEGRAIIFLVEEGEACDDANDVETDACLTTCVAASCGR